MEMHLTRYELDRAKETEKHNWLTIKEGVKPLPIVRIGCSVQNLSAMLDDVCSAQFFHVCLLWPGASLPLFVYHECIVSVSSALAQSPAGVAYSLVMREQTHILSARID